MGSVRGDSCVSISAMLTIHAEAQDFALDGVLEGETGHFRLADRCGRGVIPSSTRPAKNSKGHKPGGSGDRYGMTAEHRAWIRELGGLFIPTSIS